MATALMPVLGISRVAEVTRLDRLGLPVFASIRPRGRALCVHAGKGLDALGARVGALMEAIEYAAAEPQRTPWRPMPMAMGRFLAQFNGRLDLLDFAPLLGRDITLDDVLPTVACEELFSGDIAHLPAELVFVPFEQTAVAPFFGWSSNGLASGNTIEEATLQGVLEVIERDALTMNRVADRSFLIQAHDLPAPFCELAAHWSTLGVETAVRWVPCDTAIACFEVCLHEPASRSVHLASGSGAHPDPTVALSRAFCEAAQSRLSHLHGGRDDIVHFYGRHRGLGEAARAEADRPTVERLFDARRQVRFSEVPRLSCVDDTLAQLDAVCTILKRNSFRHVFRHRFEADLSGLEVVKVIVPRCEDAENSPRRMGRRLFDRLAAGGSA